MPIVMYLLNSQGESILAYILEGEWACYCSKHKAAEDVLITWLATATTSTHSYTPHFIYHTDLLQCCIAKRIPFQKGNVVYSMIYCGVHVTFLEDLNHLMQPSGHRMSTAINLHLVVTLAVILLSSNTFTTYVTLALPSK